MPASFANPPRLPSPQALQILASCLTAPLPRAQEQALDAFTSWLKLTGGVGLNGPMLMQSPLVRCAGVGAPAAAGEWQSGWRPGSGVASRWQAVG